MQGLELSRLYYEEYGAPMIHELFGEFENRIAVGLAGPGSDCLGFDDEVSRDHDFGAGFCLWLTDEDNEQFGFSLSRAYAKLPKIFMGFEKGRANSLGTSRYGVKTIGDFYLPLTGRRGAPETDFEWLNIPEYYLAAAVSGSVFKDELGEFSAIRSQIQNGMPRDVRLKKLAAKTALMAQSGQYNMPRCFSHGEAGAAALAAAEFVSNTVSLVFLLNGKYAPFYKWALRAMRSLELFPELADRLTELITGDFSQDKAAAKCEIVESICSEIADYLRKSGLSSSASDFLEPHAYEIQNKIKNSSLRSLHIMEG